MPMISEQWAYALDPAVRFWFEQGFGRRNALLPSLFNEQGSATATEKASSAGAVSPDVWEQYEDTGVSAQVDFDQGYLKTFTHKTFTVELPIKRELIDDNQYPQIFAAATKLGDSAALKREKDAASVFNNAFSTSYNGADGVPLCDDSHPLSPVKSGVQDNEFTLALTQDNVGTIREAMMAFTDDNGSKVAVTPNMLLVPPALEDEALIIAKSINDPVNANNAINPQAGRWTVQPWHYLTDSNAWFMIDSILMKMSLLWFNRIPLSILPKVEDKTLRSTWIAYMRYSYGWSDWRWIAGSNPS